MQHECGYRTSGDVNFSNRVVQIICHIEAVSDNNNSSRWLNAAALPTPSLKPGAPEPAKSIHFTSRNLNLADFVIAEI